MLNQCYGKTQLRDIRLNLPLSKNIAVNFGFDFSGDDDQRCSSSSHVALGYFVSGAMIIMARILIQ